MRQHHFLLQGLTKALGKINIFKAETKTIPMGKLSPHGNPSTRRGRLNMDADKIDKKATTEPAVF